MDVFCDAREVIRRFERYVIDLRRLFTFHGLACGAAENFCDLAVKLEESRALRLDLPALLRNIRDMEQEQMTADEMLTVVALASGGEELVDGRAGSAGLMRTVGMLQMMLAGVGTWAETNGEERIARAVTTEGSAGEERIFLELAIEELRLQLGEVTRRMGQLEPQVHGTHATAESVPRVEELGPEDGGGEADPYGTQRNEEILARAAEQHAAEQAAVETVEREAEREAALREAAEREAREAAALERERARAWPLEERVSSLPAIPHKPAAKEWEIAQAQGESYHRRRRLQMAGIAAGLLLATIGIYGSLRSTTVQADRKSSGTAGSPSAGAAAVGPGSSNPVAPVPRAGISPTQDAARKAGGDALPAVGAMVTKPRAEGGLAVAAGKAPAGARPATTEASPAAVAKVTGPVERKAVVPVAPDVTAKNRRDDAAVEAALAERQTGGKFMFVPADVMEKHLLSGRKPVVPSSVKGEQGPARVVLNAFIAKDGTVSRTDVVEGPPQLINSAMAAVSWRRYRPFLVRGQPAEVVTPVVVSYGVAH